MRSSHQRDQEVCLSDAELLAFDRGRVADVALLERMAEHLGECDTCESRLEAVSSNSDTVIALIRASDPFDFHELESQDGSLDSTNPIDHDVLRKRTERRTAQAALPEKIGKYFVESRLGQGSFGTVYKARDPDNDRWVAIKVPRLHSDDAAEEFLREARTGLRLEHPNIVKIFDWGRQDDGSCFVVMQCIEGRSLREELKSPVSHERAAKLTAEIARALHHAHSRDIYHRDVKPANILMRQDGSAVLTDFGLAIREEERWEHEDTAAGTYAYMSPEQVRAESQFINEQADIWSLGVILYEMLTGNRPFSGDTQTALFQDIEHREPRPPRVIDPTIPPHLEEICLKCLDKRQSARYRSAGELANDLTPVNLSHWKWAAIVVVLLFIACATAFARSVLDGASSSEPFLNHSPTVIAQNTTIPENVWDASPDDERFEIKSIADIALAAFGETKSRNLKLQIAIHMDDDWKGQSGVFWGLHDTRPGPETAFGCFAVVVGREEQDGPFTVEIQQFDLLPDAGPIHYVATRHHLAVADIEQPSTQFAILDVQVSDTGTVSIRFDDRAVELAPECTVDWPRIGETQYGITSMGAFSVFENGRIDF